MTIETSETATVVKPCLEWLKLHGIMAWRQNVGGFLRAHEGKRRFVKFGRPGMSDIAGILPAGRALYIECKLAGKALTHSQRAFLDEVNATGGLGIVVHSVDELIERLER